MLKKKKKFYFFRLNDDDKMFNKLLDKLMPQYLEKDFFQNEEKTYQTILNHPIACLKK